MATKTEIDKLRRYWSNNSYSMKYALVSYYLKKTGLKMKQQQDYDCTAALKYYDSKISKHFKYKGKKYSLFVTGTRPEYTPEEIREDELANKCDAELRDKIGIMQENITNTFWTRPEEGYLKAQAFIDMYDKAIGGNASSSFKELDEIVKQYKKRK